MRGQLSIDVIIAIVVFIVFVSYLFFQLLTLRPIYLQQIKVEKVKSEAYQISELLINDPGEPIDWNAGNVLRIGLSDHSYNLTNLISWSKALELNKACNPPGSFENVRNKIGVKKEQFMIVVINATGHSLICSPPPETITIGVVNFTVKRVVGIRAGNNIAAGEVTVRAW